LKNGTTKHEVFVEPEREREGERRGEREREILVFVSRFSRNKVELKIFFLLLRLKR
jgi:hypothetical protein